MDSVQRNNIFTLVNQKYELVFTNADNGKILFNDL